MAGLVVEKNIGGESFEKGRLLQAAQEQGLVETDIPLAQGADDPLMGGRRAGGDQGCADRAGIVGKLALQQIQRREKSLERSAGQRLPG